MSFLHALQNYLNGARGAGLESAAPVVAPSEFRRLILKERDRAGRNDKVFSLVLVEARSSNHRPTRNHRLAQILARQLRNLDAIGWFDETRLGILLPYTPRDGAHQVLERIREALKDVGGIHCEIYTYPDQRLFEMGGE
jgi:hypothetical protein